MDPHGGDETQRGLLALLETAQQQQQVALLIHQRLSEALGTQVALVQTLHLQTKTRPQARVTIKQMVKGATRGPSESSADLAVAGQVTDGSVFRVGGDLGELGLGAPQLSLQAGERVFEGGFLLTQRGHAPHELRILLQQCFQCVR